MAPVQTKIKLTQKMARAYVTAIAAALADVAANDAPQHMEPILAVATRWTNIISTSNAFPTTFAPFANAALLEFATAAWDLDQSTPYPERGTLRKVVHDLETAFFATLFQEGPKASYPLRDMEAISMYAADKAFAYNVLMGNVEYDAESTAARLGAVLAQDQLA